MYTSERELSVSKLFSHPVQYKVPHYQRRYVWDKTNWRALSEDILAQLGLELKEGLDSEYAFEPLEQHKETSTSPRQGDDKKHFTGIIVTRQISHGEPEIFEVIDGQQRLTTFQIILCVIRDIFLWKDDPEQAEEPQKLIVNEGTVVKRAGEETTYKFRPTNFDSSEFEDVASKEYGRYISEMAFDEETNSLRNADLLGIRNVFTDSDNHNILDAYDYFYQLTMTYINKNEDWKHELVELLIAIKTQLNVVLTTLDDSDHSEKIFESINATGRKLAEFDYLRNNLFLRAKQLDNPEEEEFESDRFLRDYWTFENSHSYWSANKLESFLRAFLMAKLGASCFQSGEVEEKDTRKAFEVYQKSYYKKVKDKAIKDNLTPIKKVEYEFSELKRYAKAYREADFGDLEFVSQSDKIRFHMKFYDDLNMTSLLPFILYLQCEVGQTEELETVFKILESYLVRRMLEFGNGPNDKDERGYERIYGYFSELIDENKNRKFDLKEFAQSLEDWPDDGRLPNYFKKISNDTRETNRSLSQGHARFQLSYIFYRIERYANRKYKLSFNDFLSAYELTRIASEQELLLPYGNKISDTDWRELQDDWISIGNLAFSAENKINPGKVDNFSFEDTRKVLLKGPNASLKLNNEICRLNKLEAWGSTQIHNRQKYLSRYFRAIWPDQKSILETISKQTRKSEKEAKPMKPTRKTISLPETSVVPTPKTVEKQDSKLKTCRGKVKLWMGSYGYIESSDLETRIEVNISDFQDRTAANPVQQEQKVKFEIDRTQSEKNLKPINLVRIKE